MENGTMVPIDDFPPGLKIALHSLLLPCSLVGNVLVIAVVHVNAPLKTRFNYLIVNMALADLVVPLVILPTNIVLEARNQQWLVGGTLGNVLCKAINFITDISPGVSVFTLVVIAVNRFIAIVFPMRVTPFSRKRLFCVISFTWILSMILFSPHLYTYRIYDDPPLYRCAASWEPLDEATSIRIFMSIFIVVVFVIPFSIISVVYSILTYKIYKMSEGVQNMLNNQQAQFRQRRNKQIFYMSLAVVLAFALLWGPLFAFFFVYVFVWKTMPPPIPMNKIIFVLNFVGLSNSVVHPCVCFLFMKTFRQGFKKVIRRNIADINRRCINAVYSRYSLGQQSNAQVIRPSPVCLLKRFEVVTFTAADTVNSFHNNIEL